VTANSDDEETIKRFRSYGIEPWFNKRFHDSTHPHPVSAGIRTKMTAWAFGKMRENGKTHICSLYASPRDSNILAQLNLGVLDPMRLTSYRPILTAEDISRENMIRAEDLVQCDTLFMCDVYSLEPRFGSTLNPDNIYRIMRLSGVRDLYWVGHDFIGDAGTCEGEAAWIRKNNLIYFRPDKRSATYAAHDPCDWIWEQTQHAITFMNHLVWHVTKTVGSFSLVHFRISDEPVIDGTRVIKTPQFVLEDSHVWSADDEFPTWQQEMAMSICSYGASWYSDLVLPLVGCKQRRILMQTTLLLDLPTLLERRTPGVLREATIQGELRHYFKNPELKLLMSLFPQEFVTFTRDLPLHLMLKTYAPVVNIEARAAQLLPLSDRFANAMRTSSEPSLVKKMVFQIGRQHGRTLIVVVLTLLLYVALKKKSFLGNLWMKYSKVASLLPLLVKIFGGTMPQKMVSLIASPIVEEVLKKTQLCSTLPEVELTLRLCQGEQIFSSLIPYGVHKICSILPLPYAILGHAVYNGLALYTQRDAWATEYDCKKHLLAQLARAYPFLGIPTACIWTLVTGKRECPLSLDWEQFKYYYYEAPWHEREVHNLSRNSISRYDPMSARVESQHTSCVYEAVIPDPLLIHKNTLPQIQKETKVYTHFFLPTSMPTLRASASTRNLEAVNYLRLLKPNIITPLEQRPPWEEIRRDLPLDLGQTKTDLFVWEELVPGWIDKMDSAKRKRYENALTSFLAGGISLLEKAAQTTKIMVKTDEVLMQVKLANLNGRERLMVTLKPRPIANVNPVVQIYLGPNIYECQHAIAARWCERPEPYVFGGLEFYMTYACGFTDHNLSSWWWFAHNRLRSGPGVFILVSGDDSLIVMRVAERVWYVEADASMFDQTQSGAVLETVSEYYRYFGLDQQRADFLVKLAHSDYVSYAKEDFGGEFRIKRKLRGYRDTGGADTSLGNSVAIGLAFKTVIQRTNYSEPLLDQWLLEFKRLGFQMKMKVTLDSFEVSFLKGLWYSVHWPSNTADHLPWDRYWGPLPSRVLKVGKSYRDPREIYGIHQPGLTYERAANLYLSDVAHGYSYFLQVPLLRSFVDAFDEGDLVDKRVGIDWRMFVDQDICKPRIDEMDTWVQLRSRYGEVWDDYNYWEKIFPHDPFHFLSGPIWLALGLRDYS